MVNLKVSPFYLSEEGIKWVEDTFNSMTFEEKIGQLFCPIVFTNDEEELKELVQTKQIGGVLYREGNGIEIQNNHRLLQEASKIPLLIASNLEQGGTGSALEGTFYGKQMTIAATDNVERAYQLGKVAAREGAAVGVNWALAPVVDIDFNFRNPITNIRTFGSDKERVLAMGKAFQKAVMEEGLATSVKHFPGDGVDERDQHLLISVNSMSVDEWENTFGIIYKSLIEDGALTIMAGHIAMPSYEEKITGKLTNELIPATLSKVLLQNVLREQLGFNGLITTDATPMVGFCCAMEREKAIPTAIENGCDIILFNKDLDEDIRFMIKGVQNGLLSQERLNDAVMRILATKAAMKLPQKQKEYNLVPEPGKVSILGCVEHITWAKECADEAVTLVKDTQKLLPIRPDQHRRILLQILGGFPSNDRVANQFDRLLKEEGFEIIHYIKEDFTRPLDNVQEFKSKYDLVLYIGNVDNASNKTVSRINWFTFFGLGNNMPWFVKEVPTMFVSIGNPYHLLDVPMVKTYINGYCNNSYIIDAIVEKITGKSSFKGISPIDPFCGREDTRY